MDDVTCSFIHFYLPKRKKTLRPSFMTTHTLPLTLLRHLLVILREPVISRQFSISPVFLFRYLLSDSGGQPDIMAPKNTDFDKLSTNELVEHLVEISGVLVPKADVKIMGRSNITGCNLVHSGTEQAFEKVGLSWDTGANLTCLKENYLKKKS